MTQTSFTPRLCGTRPAARRLAGTALALAGIAACVAPASAQLQSDMPFGTRPRAVEPCCQPYDARGAARDLSLSQQQRVAPLPAPPRVENLAPDPTARRAPTETRPGMALEGTASPGPGTAYDGESRSLFRPVEPPAPLD